MPKKQRKLRDERSPPPPESQALNFFFDQFGEPGFFSSATWTGLCVQGYLPHKKTPNLP